MDLFNLMAKLTLDSTPFTSGLSAAEKRARVAADNINQALNSIRGIGGVFGSIFRRGGTDGSHASGLWEVPYDNYIAQLHRGERVLSASQARQGVGVDSVNNNAELILMMKQAFSEALGKMKIELNNKQVGKVVGDSTSSRVHQNIDAANRKTDYGYGR